ncbi:23S rRNA pseudouridine2605 synthase [Caminicella sporogenes DSM 14501]|uniref:Pseudouridine synthase n=1 Tax=Caminicella sporogenes DSM 14501 TaxID=1121266 RepID=A0A1M6L3W7_9FIRM|nr:pseudouridine synthase [Caminicella sporogenes]SHJ65911.1 23S rRNA pseudouridine2605 synthase [Caminicella sporogenes DSM 14501]
MRLQKYIAMAGIASRRKAEEYIKQGKVKVNGKIVTEMGVKIDPDKDEVYFNGKKVFIQDKKIYIMLNKPEGYVTTLSDEFNRPKVIDLISGIDERIYPIGRLDYNTSGLLLLTNDGDLTNKLTHPKNHIDKIYIAKIKGIITAEKMKKFCSGIDIGGYITAPANIKLIEKYKKNCLVKIIIHEGKNRQIRRMMDILGHPVITLKRIAIGKLSLGNLKKGSWRYLSEKEVNYLKSI